VSVKPLAVARRLAENGPQFGVAPMRPLRPVCTRSMYICLSEIGLKPDLLAGRKYAGRHPTLARRLTVARQTMCPHIAGTILPAETNVANEGVSAIRAHNQRVMRSAAVGEFQNGAARDDIKSVATKYITAEN
jgi:hypothetical protein